MTTISPRSTQVSSRFVWLNGTDPINPDEFGWKAANLCGSPRVGKYVPIGIALSREMVARICQNSLSETELTLFETEFWRLRERANGSLIVRSSSVVEASESDSFSGIMASVRDVTNFKEFRAAAARCYKHSMSPSVGRYSRMRGIELPPDHLGLLVQKQVEIKYSALVRIYKDECLLEAFVGDISNRIKGIGEPESIYLTKLGKTEILKSDERIPNKFFDSLKPLVRGIGDSVSEGAAIVEAASDGSRIYLFQIGRTLEDQNLSRKLIQGLGPVLEAFGVDELGLKAAAMNYFSERGLFHGGAVVCAPNESLKYIEEKVSSSFAREDSGYTVRFSEGCRLGLPRGFVNGLENAVKWVGANREDGWAAIIHPHIDVIHSFEVLLTDDELHLEHVPGMWESDNNLDPDVLILSGGRMKFWRYLQERKAKFIGLSEQCSRSVKPQSCFDLEDWASRISEIAEMLRRDFGSILPLNFHFVEDSNGFWYFLNIRRGFELKVPLLRSESFYPVRSVADLTGWDSKTPLYLRFSTPRGSENKVLDFVEFLADKKHIPIVIGFGILSHPAMILREFGFSLIPSYQFFGSKLNSPMYEVHDQVVDLEDDPIRRIQNEEPIFSCESFKVVLDKSQIVNGHHLLVSNRDIKSFADDLKFQSDFDSLVQFGIDGWSDYRPGWVLIERGRASFCTSGFTRCHAHAHMMPLKSFGMGVSESFGSFIEAEKMHCLGSALEKALQSESEYIIFADSLGAVFLRIYEDGLEPSKRLIRRFFTAHKK